MSKYIWMNRDYGITKIGFDLNGNYCYWVKALNGNRPVRVPHGSIASEHKKVTMLNIHDGSKSVLFALDAIVAQARKGKS